MLADNLSAEPLTPGGVAMRRHSRGSAAENFLWKSMLAAGNQGDGVAPPTPAVMKNLSERGREFHLLIPDIKLDQICFF